MAEFCTDTPPEPLVFKEQSIPWMQAIKIFIGWKIQQCFDFRHFYLNEFCYLENIDSDTTMQHLQWKYHSLWSSSIDTSVGSSDRADRGENAVLWEVKVIETNGEDIMKVSYGNIWNVVHAFIISVIKSNRILIFPLVGWHFTPNAVSPVTHSRKSFFQVTLFDVSKLFSTKFGSVQLCATSINLFHSTE